MALACRECGAFNSVPRGMNWQLYRCRLCSGRLRVLRPDEREDWGRQRANGTYPPCYEGVPWIYADAVQPPAVFSVPASLPGKEGGV